MITDQYKTLVMEHCSFPGNIGDSCAETGRYKHLLDTVEEFGLEVDLNAFITEEGFVRHPTAPEKDDHGDSWRETDFSSDQALPLFLGGKGSITRIVGERIKAAGYKTGNGDFVSPIFFALLTGRFWLVDLCIIGQLIAFALPWRWSDQYNRFEEMKESSADYLNFIHAAIYAHPWIKKLLPKNKLKQKIRDYYQVEPNSEFLIALYDRVIDEKL